MWGVIPMSEEYAGRVPLHVRPGAGNVKGSWAAVYLLCFGVYSRPVLSRMWPNTPELDLDGLNLTAGIYLYLNKDYRWAQ
jgi:hypothetical protein